MSAVEKEWRSFINRPFMGRLATEDATYGLRRVQTIESATRTIALAVLEDVLKAQREGRLSLAPIRTQIENLPSCPNGSRDGQMEGE